MIPRRNFLKLSSTAVLGLTLGRLPGMAEPIRSVSKNWLEQVKGYQVPDWFANANRVQAHTRLSVRRWLDDPVFREAPKYFKALGFEVFTRQIKGGDEPAWWPSSVGAVLPQVKDRNIGKEIIEQAHAQGLRIIVYYRHMEDAEMAKEHPEWICRDAHGRPYEKRGLKMCFNTPYRDFVEKRLLELTAMGADGFYFDENHQPDVCTCPSCRQNGKDRGEIIREMFLKYRKAIHERNPEVVLLISGRFEGLSHDLWRLPDVCKFEPHVARKYGGTDLFGYALGLTFIRDAADGKAGNLWWSHNQKGSLFDCAQTLAFGHIFEFDLPEDEIADPNSPHCRAARKYTSLGATLTPYLKRTIPLRNALVHYPKGEPQGSIQKPTVPPAFRDVIAAHVPTGTIIDSQLREGIPPECGLLVIPNSQKAPLQDPQVAHNIAAFQQRGGLLVTDPIHKNGKNAISEWRRRAPIYATQTIDELMLTAYRTENNDRWTVILLNPTKQATGAKLCLHTQKKLQGVSDILTGKALPVTSSGSDAIVEIAPFQVLAAISISC